MFVFTVGSAGLRNIFPVLKFLTALIFLISINFLTRSRTVNAFVNMLFLQPC